MLKTAHSTNSQKRMVKKTDPCPNGPDLLLLKLTVMLYTVQQWGVCVCGGGGGMVDRKSNTGCSIHDWQT